MAPSPFTRRSALRLGALGLVSSVAGCTAGDDEEPSDETITTTGESTTTSGTRESTQETLEMGETATSGTGQSVTVSDPRVRKIIFTPDEGTITHAYPSGESHSQFLVVSVTAEGRDIPTLQLAPVIGETRQESESYRHTFSPGSSGLLGFPVPTGEAESGALEWRPTPDQRYLWILPDSVVSDLARAPQFEVVEFGVPEAIARDEPFTATLAVRNTGERNGRFLAVVLDEGASSLPLHEMFTESIPVDETITRELTGRELEGEESNVTALLDWGIGERRETFTVSE